MKRLIAIVKNNDEYKVLQFIQTYDNWVSFFDFHFYDEYFNVVNNFITTQEQELVSDFIKFMKENLNVEDSTIDYVCDKYFSVIIENINYYYDINHKYIVKELEG